RREELLVDAIAGDRLALIVAVAQVRTVKAGADRAAEAGPVAMLDNQAAPRRESLLPVPGFADRPERLGASPRQAGIGEEPDQAARGGHRDAVIGQSGRGEGQSEQDRDAVHGLRVPCRSRNEKGDKKGAGIPAPSLPLSEKVQASAGRAPLAWAMIALNASPSCIAMSARTLRSRSTPASLRPCMKRP